MTKFSEVSVNISDITISRDQSHHVHDGTPLYTGKFKQVLSFHPPGVAAVDDGHSSYHIGIDGQPIYKQRFKETFGFYGERAAVVGESGWHHIDLCGSPVYSERYSWVGNYQGGYCTVRDRCGQYSHIDPFGKPAYKEKYPYAGDFRGGTAVVYTDEGFAIHIEKNGNAVHSHKYWELGVYHKGYAVAKDSRGYFHVDIDGLPAYDRRFSWVEPFYNGHALARLASGELEVIGENGETTHCVLGDSFKSVKTYQKNAIMDKLVGYWSTQILYSMVRMGVLDKINEGVTKFSALKKEVGIPAQSLRLLLRIGVVWHLIETDHGTYSLRYPGKMLSENYPDSLKYAALMWGEEHYQTMSRLVNALVEYQPQFDHTFSQHFFDYFQSHPERGNLYARAMGEYSTDYDDVIAKCDFSSSRQVLDIGGGSGRLLKKVLATDESIEEGILFDLPNIVEDAEKHFQTSTSDHRIRCVGGDFFEKIPEKVDTILLSRVVHDWCDEKAQRILENCKDALQAGGRVMIFEMIIPDVPKEDFGDSLNFNLLVMVGGKERTLNEFKALFRSAGLTLTQVEIGSGIISLLVAESTCGGI